MAELARDLETTKAAPATPSAAPPEPAPPAPVPMAIATLRVGHAEDRAESDADKMADSALSRLRRMSTDAASAGSTEQDSHVHGPACDHLRRSTAPSLAAGPVVGREGGDLDAVTTSAIDSARGSGAPLRGDVKRRMETAFATDFSGVRVHDDDRSAKLNTAVSAHAFTTGNDIFFGRGQFAPSTPSGERMLAHELAHVVQNSGSGRRTLDPRAATIISRQVDRSRTIAREFTLPWRKTPEQKAAAAQEQTRKDGGKTLKELNEKVKKAGEQRQADREATGATLGGIVKDHQWEQYHERLKDERAKKYEGPAGGGPSLGEEVGKPSAAGAVIGSTHLGTSLSGATDGSMAALGGLLLGDTAMGIRKGMKMRDDGHEYDDKAMVALGNRKLLNQGSGFAAAAIGATSAGVGIAASKAGVMSSMTQAGWTTAGKAGTAAGGAALATGGAAVGIVSGSAQVLQGMWRGGKAVMKLCRLAWGRAATMLSGRGPDWKQAIMSAEKYKAAIAALKTGLGVLGIAAGALFLVSNPVGWGIGIAAAVAGGVWAAVKIAAKVKDANDRRKAADAIAKGAKPAEVFDDVTGGAKDAPSSSAAKPKAEKSGTGFVTGKMGPKTAKADNRTKAIENAEMVARMASSHARLAHELRSALRAGNKSLVAGALERAAQDKEFSLAHTLEREEDRELHDSMLLLSSINVDPDEALAESGQELIEKKLSKLEAM